MPSSPSGSPPVRRSWLRIDAALARRVAARVVGRLRRRPLVGVVEAGAVAARSRRARRRRRRRARRRCGSGTAGSSPRPAGSGRRVHVDARRSGRRRRSPGRRARRRRAAVVPRGALRPRRRRRRRRAVPGTGVDREPDQAAVPVVVRRGADVGDGLGRRVVEAGEALDEARASRPRTPCRRRRSAPTTGCVRPEIATLSSNAAGNAANAADPLRRRQGRTACRSSRPRRPRRAQQQGDGATRRAPRNPVHRTPQNLAASRRAPHRTSAECGPKRACRTPIV